MVSTGHPTILSTSVCWRYLACFRGRDIPTASVRIGHVQHILRQWAASYHCAMSTIWGLTSTAVIRAPCAANQRATSPLPVARSSAGRSACTCSRMGKLQSLVEQVALNAHGVPSCIRFFTKIRGHIYLVLWVSFLKQEWNSRIRSTTRLYDLYLVFCEAWWFDTLGPGVYLGESIKHKKNSLVSYIHKTTWYRASFTHDEWAVDGQTKRVPHPTRKPGSDLASPPTALWEPRAHFHCPTLESPVLVVPA